MTANLSYAGDNKEFMLSNLHDSAGIYTPIRFFIRDKYLTDRKIQRCPTTGDVSRTEAWEDVYAYGFKGDYNGERIRRMRSDVLGMGYSGNNYDILVINTKAIPKISSFFLNGDSREPNMKKQRCDVDMIEGAAATNNNRFAAIHPSGKMNLNFADGHAASTDPLDYVSMALYDWPKPAVRGSGTNVYWLDRYGILRVKWWFYGESVR